jgi:hypothetical protein
MKIRRELLIVILIVLVIPLLIIASYSIEAIKANAKEEMRLRANSLAERCDSAFSEIERQCHTIGVQAIELESNKSIYKFDPDEYYFAPNGNYLTKEPEKPEDISYVWVRYNAPIDSEMRHALSLTKNLESLYKSVKQNPNIMWVYTGHEAGLMRCYPWINESRIPRGDPRNRPWYTIATPANNPSKQIVWTHPFASSSGEAVLVSCAMPLYDKEGKFFGVQCIDLALDSINKNITGAKLYNSGYAFLILKPEFQIKLCFPPVKA